jgi:predicted ATPase/class 3 adenylate cyclase
MRAGTDAVRDRQPHTGPPDGDTRYSVLISDLERSTELWELHDDVMQDVIAEHNRLAVACVDEHDGWLVQFRGDGILALFPSAREAVLAAVDLQRTFSGRPFGAVGELGIRIGINTGECSIVDGELYGRPPNLASRLESAGHGGQIVLADSTATDCERDLPDDVTLFELGRYRLRGYAAPIVLHSVVAPGLRSVFPPLRTLTQGLDDLPDDGEPLIGREDLIAEVEDLVRAHPLVTLVGPAGVGKTRVAVRAGGQVRRPFRQGVRFVDLTTVTRPEDVVGAVAEAVHAQRRATDDANEQAGLRRFLQSARLVLVLDNCEHVLDAVRSLIDGAVGPAPGVHVLATSREPIGASDEHVVTLAPLATPPPGTWTAHDIEAVDAVRVFVKRAQAADPAFALTDDNAADVATVCRAVDGMPLALQLAAARMDVTTVEQLAASRSALVESVLWSDREGRVNLAGSVQWSHARLDASAARLLARLAVFAGGFTSDMARSLVLADERPRFAPTFDTLVRSSMVVRDQIDGDRYRLLETTRQLLASVAAEADTERDRVAHAQVMLERAERWGPRIKTSDAGMALSVLRSDMPDYQRAIDWFLATDALAEATRLLVSLYQYAFFDLQLAVHRWASALAGLVRDADPLASEVIGAAALTAWFTGDIDRAIALGERAVAIADEHGGSTIWARTALVDAHSYVGNSRELSRHSLLMVDELIAHDDLFWQINGMGYQVLGLALFGRFDDARRRADETLAVARRLGNAFCTYWALYVFGLAVVDDEPDAALAAWEAAMTAARETNSRYNISMALSQWVTVCRHRGRTDDSRTGALDLLESFGVTENRSELALVLSEVAHLLADGDEPEAAALALLSGADLPRMPGGSSDPVEDGALREHLQERLGDRWLAVSTRAMAIPEAQLLAECRDALVRLPAAG